MKFPFGIEISGIHTIMIDRKWNWERGTLYTDTWQLFIPYNNHCQYHQKTMESMMDYVRSLCAKTHRAYFHDGTLNIIRKDEQDRQAKVTE